MSIKNGFKYSQRDSRKPFSLFLSKLNNIFSRSLNPSFCDIPVAVAVVVFFKYSWSKNNLMGFTLGIRPLWRIFITLLPSSSLYQQQSALSLYIYNLRSQHNLYDEKENCNKLENVIVGVRFLLYKNYQYTNVTRYLYSFFVQLKTFFINRRRLKTSARQKESAPS